MEKKPQNKAGAKAKKVKKEVKHAKESDPAPPKRPQNGFFRYKQEVFEDFRAKNKDVKIGKISSLIADAYKALSETEQKKYSEPYQTEMEQYRKVRFFPFLTLFLGYGGLQG